jgi:hypothetical protein
VITKATLALWCFLIPSLAGAELLDIYGAVTGKTVLMSSSWPRLKDVTMPASTTNQTAMIAWAESELAKQGMAIIPDGPHFVVILPEFWRSLMTNISLRGAEFSKSQSSASMGTGTLDFRGASVEDSLRVYSTCAHRNILRPARLPIGQLKIKSSSTLSREEIAYAMETLLALNDIAIVEDGTKFAQVLSMAQRGLVKTNAPASKPGEELLDPNKVPAVGVADPIRPRSKTERDLDHWRKVLADFLHFKPPQDRSAGDLLELYADLADKSVEPSKDLDATPVWFKVTMPMTKRELLYAIETTFGLENLHIVSKSQAKVQLERVPVPAEKK